MSMRKSLIKVVVLSVLTIVFSACGNGFRFGIASQTQYFNQGSGTFSNNQLDILWVIDNSGSMVPLQNNMISNFGSIVTMFRNKGYDYRMAVTTSDAYLGDPTLSGYLPAYAPYTLFRDGAGANHSGVFVMNPQTPNIDAVFVTNASQGSAGGGDERVFSSMRATLMDGNNPAFLRPNAFLSIIILSDEDDFSGNTRPYGAGVDHDYAAPTLDPVSSYIGYLDAVTNTSGATRRYNVNTIAVTDAACLNELVGMGNGSIIGQRYMDLSNQTSGVIGSICDISFANSLSAIAQQILTLSSQFYLARPAQEQTIIVYVNGRLIPKDPQNGWTYNPAAHSILFHGTSIPVEGARISVSFTPVGII